MDFTPLRRHRDYRFLYIAQTVSFLGTMMTYVALPYQMFQLTHSSLKVGLLGLAELIPLLLTAFIGGALADSVDRRRMVIVTNLFLTCGSLALSLLAGIEMVSYLSGPMLGHLEAGAAAALFGVRASVVSGGVLCVVGVLACGLLLPRFVSYDAHEFQKKALV